MNGLLFFESLGSYIISEITYSGIRAANVSKTYGYFSILNEIFCGYDCCILKLV